MTVAESIQIMKALADSSRLLIINSLISKPQCVEELSERLKLAASTVSFHLKKLEEAHVVYKEKQQYYAVFLINEDIFNYTLKQIVSFENIEKIVQDERIDAYKQKVIRTFFKNGKLEKIPTQHKKRWIILEKIAKAFNKGKIYSEKEVNEIITQYHDDYCTIRRDFIDEKIMQREGDKYWLSEEAPEDSIKLMPRFRRSFNESVSSKMMSKK